MAVDLFFPPCCINCGREGNYICGRCRQLLPAITPPVCPVCGRPRPQAVICPRCADEPPEIDGIRSPFIFQGIIRQAIHELKYRNLRALVPSLAELLHEYLEENPVPGDVLVPVPLHRKRLRERGYNQSALIAAGLGRLRGLPAVTDCLVRHSYAPPQARSGDAGERHRNVAGAFTCRDRRLSGRRVIIIDDVVTSGATLNAGAGALKAAGAATVWGLTLALEP